MMRITNLKMSFEASENDGGDKASETATVNTEDGDNGSMRRRWKLRNVSSD